MKGSIELRGLTFFSHHGLHPHERSIGHQFEVDVVIQTNFSPQVFHDDLSGSIDYEKVYSIVNKKMSKPVSLLETVAHGIADEIMVSFVKKVKKVDVRVAKCHPPIKGLCRQVAVTICKESK